jgi:regulator of PEP synthase PpsR (kinase-PPPase family)
MTITLKIDNSDIEEQLKQFVKEKQEITVDALRKFLNSFQKDEQFVYKKKDPRKHSFKREYIDEGNEDLSDVKPYAHVEDSGQYIHDLRRQRNR